MATYVVCAEGVDDRKNNQEGMFTYEAKNLVGAMQKHAMQVGTKVVAIFDKSQKTVGFRQWA